MRGTDWTPRKLIDFVDHIADLHDSGKIPFALHLPGGNEEQLINIFSNIQPNDYVLSTHRNMYHALLHGLDPKYIERNILDAKSMFMFDRDRNFYVSAIIGGTVAIAAGIALALKRKNSDQKVWCFIGDGTEDSGHLAEAARYVSGFDLPCTFIIEDDSMAVEASKLSRWGKIDNPIWPSCVIRYEYTKTRPHIRTGKFADLETMKRTKKSEEYYFPKLIHDSAECEILGSMAQMGYKDSITLAMKELGEKGAIFIGYSINPGDAMGTLKDVPSDQKIETPVAENLMLGLAIGMSFEGMKPVVYFERHDFMLVAADAIGNHLSKIERISLGQFKTPVILKTVVDDGGLFYSGPTHSQNFTELFRHLVDFPVLDATSAQEALAMYRYAAKADYPVMVVEHKKFF